MRARPDIVSVTHVHPDYTVLMTVFGKELKPMAQEGAALVSKPLPMMNMMKIVQTEEEGAEVASLLGDGDIVLLRGHGAVTVSTRSVQQCVMNMAQLEHQARLNYLAMAAGGMDYPSIPLDLALQPQHPLPPHLAARVANIEGDRQGGEGIWGYFRERVTADM
jgi:ribulose-5-phosphate 4-epimerase/fuculose-1-phosphate aldolase